MGFTLSYEKLIIFQRVTEGRVQLLTAGEARDNEDSVVLLLTLTWLLQSGCYDLQGF